MRVADALLHAGGTRPLVRKVGHADSLYKVRSARSARASARAERARGGAPVGVGCAWGRGTGGRGMREGGHVPVGVGCARGGTVGRGMRVGGRQASARPCIFRQSNSSNASIMQVPCGLALGGGSRAPSRAAVYSTKYCGLRGSLAFLRECLKIAALGAPPVRERAQTAF